MENSPFARLPAELRTSIYEHTLVDPNGVLLCCKGCSGRRDTSHRHPHELVARLAPSQRCGQIRRESWSMFFSANTFPCQSYSICDLDGGFKDTLARLPPVFSLAMRSIRLQLLEPLCLWRFPGEFPGRAEHKGGESHVTAKLTSLLRSMRVCGEQMPGCRVVFESRLCYDLGTKVELVMVEDDETWARTLNHVMDQRHWKGIADADKQAATQDLQNFARGTLVSVLRRGIQPPRQ